MPSSRNAEESDVIHRNPASAANRGDRFWYPKYSLNPYEGIHGLVSDSLRHGSKVSEMLYSQNASVTIEQRMRGSLD
jgi:hypothetical protein